MPYPNYLSARQSDPGSYTRIRVAKNKGGRGVDFLFGFKKGGGSEIQSVHFDKKLFTPARARKWLKAHGLKTALEAIIDGELMKTRPTIEAHTPSHEEIRGLIQNAINEKYQLPNNDMYYIGRFIVHKVWDDKVLVCKSWSNKEDDDPKWALMDYTIDEGGDSGTPSAEIGDLVSVQIRAVPTDGSDEGIVIDEAGRRNSSVDSAKINTAMQALMSLVDEEDVEPDTISLMRKIVNADSMKPLNAQQKKEGLSELDDDFDLEEAKYTDKPWDGAKSRFTDEQLLRSVPGAIAAWVRAQVAADKGTVKGLAALPYKEPDGTVNLGGVRNALARATQVKGIPSNVVNRAKAELEKALAAGNKALGKNKEGQEQHDQDMITESWGSLPGETFAESFSSALSEVEVDHENRILKNVVILGAISTNGRKYPVKTQKEARSLFEGIKAYVNHPKLNEMKEPRDVRDLIGEHKNVRVVGDKTVSDLHLLDNAVVRDVVLPVAEQKPHLVGNSIVAHGKMVKEDNGTYTVDQILAVRSVDMVTEPATTKSLFAEGKQVLTEEEMDFKDLTLETLRKERPDLLEAITAALQSENEGKALKDKIVELEKGLLERDGKIANFELERAKTQRDTLIESLFKTAKIPDRVKYVEKEGARSINPHFRPLLERCQEEIEMKELIRTWEETYRQGPISEEKRLNFDGNNDVGDADIEHLHRAFVS